MKTNQTKPPIEPEIPEIKWVGVRDIATRYNVTERTVYLWKDEGRIPHIKIGKTVRFNFAEVIEIIEGKGTQA